MNDLVMLTAAKAPALVAVAGDRAVYRFLEFFTAQIRTRQASVRTVGAFFACLKDRRVPRLQLLAQSMCRLRRGAQTPPLRPDHQAAPRGHSVLAQIRKAWR